MAQLLYKYYYHYLLEINQELKLKSAGEFLRNKIKTGKSFQIIW